MTSDLEGWVVGYCATITAQYLFLNEEYRQQVRMLFSSAEEAIQHAQERVVPHLLARPTSPHSIDPQTVKVITTDYWIPRLDGFLAVPVQDPLPAV